MDGCTERDLSASFTKKAVTLKCGKCNLQAEVPSLDYFRMWGYPKGTQGMLPAEWLHTVERRVGRDMMQKMRVYFIDETNGKELGNSDIPWGAISKLNIGDRLEFKDAGALYGIMEITAFALNQGLPEGSVNLKPIKAKAKIKLQNINEKYIDELLPF